MAANPLSLEPASIAELVNELGKNLESGGCFVAGATGLAANDACELTIVHPKTRARLVLAARVARGRRPCVRGFLAHHAREDP
jgi:hypothetical protein